MEWITYSYCDMRLPHARELEVSVELDAENKTHCLRLEKGDLKIDEDLASSDRRCRYIIY
jgi:hypothetical protein